MKITFQLLDSDYILLNNKPVIRLFGRTEDGKSITVFYDKFSPYFYVLPKEGKLTEVKNYIEKNFKNLVVKMENVEKFLPIGYQEKATKILKLTLNDPSKTPSIRDNLKEKEAMIVKAEQKITGKININTEIRVAFCNALRETLKNPENNVPYEIMKPVEAAVQKVVEEKIRIFGSAGK